MMDKRRGHANMQQHGGSRKSSLQREWLTIGLGRERLGVNFGALFERPCAKQTLIGVCC